jgi:hypothetical protein
VPVLEAGVHISFRLLWLRGARAAGLLHLLIRLERSLVMAAVMVVPGRRVQEAQAGILAMAAVPVRALEAAAGRAISFLPALIPVIMGAEA